jgi:hypothetical protein
MTTLYATYRVPGDGVNTQFEFSFSGGYMDKTHVKAYIEDAETLARVDLEILPSMFVGDFTIDVGVPIPVGKNIVIYRDTPKGGPLVDFTTGSRLTEANLDKVAQQAVFIGAETADASNADIVKQLTTSITITLDAANNAITEAQAAKAASQAAAAASAASAAEAEQTATTAITDLTTIGNDKINTINTDGNAILSELEADSAAITSTMQDLLAQTTARLLAAGLPTSVVGAAMQFLQVKADESGYEFVASTARPVFYGFNVSPDGSELLLTFGRDGAFVANDFESSMISEGLTFSIINNELVVTL